MSARLQTLGKLEAKVVCQYVWGARQGHRDELILRDRDATTSSSESSGEYLNERLWCLMDYYDPTSIVDNSGSVVERYRFSAFGLRTLMSAEFTPLDTSSYDWDFAFKGQFLDLDTGYYNYGYRYYSPELGRWLSRDPIGEKGGFNLYGMASDNPVNGVDHLGLVTAMKIDEKQEGYGSFNVFWVFSLDSDAPERTYIVQKITRIKQYKNCQTGENEGPPIKDIYWEAWLVYKNERLPNTNAAAGYTDLWFQSAEGTSTCGEVQMSGLIGVYGRSRTGNLGDPLEGTSTQGEWGLSTSYSAMAGILPSTTVEPSWWGTSNSGGEKWAETAATVIWNKDPCSGELTTSVSAKVTR